MGNAVHRLWEKRVVRFGCVGIINTVTDTGILNLLVFAFGIKLIVANVISASISIVLSYFWNHFIVFRKEHEMKLGLFLKFVIITGLSVIVVQEVVIYIVQHTLTLSRINNLTSLSSGDAKLVQVDGAKLLAVLVAMVWNYFLYQFVVFKKPQQNAADIDEEGVVPY